jgi:hypothetical protein
MTRILFRLGFIIPVMMIDGGSAFLGDGGSGI